MAPVTAVQLTLAVVVVTALEFNPVVTPQLLVVAVVKVLVAEYADEPLEQTVCT